MSMITLLISIKQCYISTGSLLIQISFHNIFPWPFDILMQSKYICCLNPLPQKCHEVNASKKKNGRIPAEARTLSSFYNSMMKFLLFFVFLFSVLFSFAY